MDLTGKAAFITGSGSGLGKGFAELLLEKGANVYISDINEDRVRATFQEFRDKFGDNRCVFSVLDTTDQARFEDVFKQATEAFGSIDIMVNNAGLVNEVDWNKAIQTNLAGTIKGTKVAFEHMRKDKGGKGGRIINISSISGLTDFYLLPVYTATKHAIRAFTTSMAQQPSIPDQGIEMSVFCPDSTYTGLHDDLDNKVEEYLDHALEIEQIPKMGMDQVTKGFLYLLEQREINGDILYVNADGFFFQTMQRCDADRDRPVS